MIFYSIKRVVLIFPTLFVIMLVNFFIIQTAPGGPVEKFIAKLNHASDLKGEVANFDISSSNNVNINDAKYSSEMNIDKEVYDKIIKLYGFDKPILERFFIMMKKFFLFDFGESFYQDKRVIDLFMEKLPVSLSLGLWTTLLTYLISIPLGIKKAIKNGSKFDIATSFAITIGYAIPSFLFAILLIVLFAGGNFLNIFPIRGIVSDGFENMSYLEKITDYLWHMALPIISMVIGGFASLTFFCKNSFLEEINKQYVVTAYSKGLKQKEVLYKHVFKNAMMIVIAGIPAALVSIIFTGSVLIEIIFSLNGVGLMGYEAAISRDYPVMFGSLYCLTLIGLVLNIISDLIYKIVDPRISFEKK